MRRSRLRPIGCLTIPIFSAIRKQSAGRALRQFPSERADVLLACQRQIVGANGFVHLLRLPVSGRRTLLRAPARSSQKLRLSTARKLDLFPLDEAQYID